MSVFRFSPREVLDFIDEDVKHERDRPADTRAPGSGGFDFKSHGHYPDAFVVPLLHMCDNLDTNAIQMPPQSRVLFIRALEHLRLACPPGGRTFASVKTMGYDGTTVNPVWALREALETCRDLPFSERWSEIRFLQAEDEPLWVRVGAALSDAHAALSQGQYRAATVVSVYVMEALLGFWLERNLKAGSIARVEFDLSKKIEQSKETGLFTPEDSVEKWDTAEVKNLQEHCESAASYRNLIHPDKQQRTNTDHDQGTAHLCLGTVLKLAQRIGAIGLPPPKPLP